MHGIREEFLSYISLSIDRPSPVFCLVEQRRLKQGFRAEMNQQTETKRRFLKPVIGAIPMLVLPVVAMSHVWMDIFQIAIRDDEASHLFLVPFVFAWLVWIRRHAIDWNRCRARWQGVALITGGVVAHEIGLANSVQALFHFSAILVLAGGLCFILGSNLYRNLLPALLVLIFLVPIPGLIRQQISVPIQYYSAAMVAAGLSCFGLDVGQNGCILTINGTEILIAEACNGMRMLMAVILSVYAFCFSVTGSRGFRVLILLILPAITIGLNGMRIAVTALLYAHGPDLSGIVFHQYSGWAIPVLIILATSVLSDDWKSKHATPALDTHQNDSMKKWERIPTAIAVGLLSAMTCFGFSSYPSPNQIARHHQDVRNAISRIPYAIGNWVAIDRPLHPEEIRLLKPNSAFRRVYRNLETGQEITVFTVACRHARDLVGHEPGICYVGQGWKILDQRPLTLDVHGIPVSGRGYRFQSQGMNRNRQTTVLSILVTPSGQTTGDTKILARKASDFRLEQYGAAAIQFAAPSIYDPKQLQESSRDILAAFLPLIHQFQAGTPKNNRARSSH